MALDQELVQMPGTAEWWLLRLGKKLNDERHELNVLNAYDRGDHPLPTGHQRARQAYGKFQRQSRTNFVGLVSDAVMDRLGVDGFRAGGDEADAQAQEIWQANNMDAGILPVLRDALVMRRAYLCVGMDDPGVMANGSGVLITGEDPRQVIHACEPTNRNRVRAALKTWTDEIDGLDHAVVYLPDGIYYYVGRRSSNYGSGPDEFGMQASKWTVDINEGVNGFAPNPTAPWVPIVPVINRPEKDKMGFGEFQDVTDVQDRINQGILDRLTTGAAQAFRQRWATGVAFKDEQGRQINPFDPGADLLWHVEADDAKFGDFAPTDIRPMIEAVKTDVEQMASVTRTPPYYLLGTMMNISGDALVAADTGATAKAEHRQKNFGESLEQMMKLSFGIVGREAPVNIETIWTDAERRNAARDADAAVKKQQVGVPWRQNMEDLGYSPAQIDRMETERARDRLQAQLTAQAMAAAGQTAGQGQEQGQQQGQQPQQETGQPQATSNGG